MDDGAAGGTRPARSTATAVMQENLAFSMEL